MRKTKIEIDKNTASTKLAHQLDYFFFLCIRHTHADVYTHTYRIRSASSCSHHRGSVEVISRPINRQKADLLRRVMYRERAIRVYINIPISVCEGEREGVCRKGRSSVQITARRQRPCWAGRALPRAESIIYRGSIGVLAQHLSRRAYGAASRRKCVCENNKLFPRDIV